MSTMADTALDWSMGGRADIGHGVIDIAPEPPAHACYTGWYARQIGIDDHDGYHVSHWLGPLLDKMATAGVLIKTGGQYRCSDRRCGRMHQEPCYYRLAIPRVEARDRWDEHTSQPRWWALTARAKTSGPAFVELLP